MKRWFDYSRFNVGRVLFYVWVSKAGNYKAAYEDTSKFSSLAGPWLLGSFGGRDAKAKAFAACREIALQVPVRYRGLKPV